MAEGYAISGVSQVVMAETKETVNTIVVVANWYLVENWIESVAHHRKVTNTAD